MGLANICAKSLRRLYYCEMKCMTSDIELNAEALLRRVRYKEGPRLASPPNDPVRTPRVEGTSATVAQVEAEHWCLAANTPKDRRGGAPTQRKGHAKFSEVLAVAHAELSAARRPRVNPRVSECVVFVTVNSRVVQQKAAALLCVFLL
jgi:hypothetical protein